MFLKLLIFQIFFHQCLPMDGWEKVRKSFKFLTGTHQNLEQHPPIGEAEPSTTIIRQKDHSDEEFVKVKPLTKEEQKEALDLEIDNEFEEIGSDAKHSFNIKVVTSRPLRKPNAPYEKDQWKVHIKMELPNMERQIALDFN